MLKLVKLEAVLVTGCLNLMSHVYESSAEKFALHYFVLTFIGVANNICDYLKFDFKLNYTTYLRFKIDGRILKANLSCTQFVCVFIFLYCT